MAEATMVIDCSPANRPQPSQSGLVDRVQREERHETPLIRGASTSSWNCRICDITDGRPAAMAKATGP